MAEKRDPRKRVLTTPARSIDGFVLFASENVQRVDEKIFTVTSREGRNVVERKVEILGDPNNIELYHDHLLAFIRDPRGLSEFKCSCEDYTYNTWICSHIFAVVHWMQEKGLLKREVQKPTVVQFRPGCQLKGEYFTLFFLQEKGGSPADLFQRIKEEGLVCPFDGVKLMGLTFKKYSESKDRRKWPRKGTTPAMQCLNPECRGITRFMEKIPDKGLFCPLCGKRGDVRYYYTLKMLLEPEYVVMSEARKR